MKQKYQKLRSLIKDLDKVAVAFSGGVDSTFLLYVAKEVLGDKAVGITVSSTIYSERERFDTNYLASDLGLKHVLVEGNEFDIPDIINNGQDRCYHCKKTMFTKIKDAAKELDILNVADGTNIDDIARDRCDMVALEELGIVSPLKEVGLNKEEIRALSKEFKVPTWDKPTMSCLASRVPFGTKITKDNLEKTDRCEMFLWNLGYSNFRVNHYGDLASISLEHKDIERFNTIDLEKVTGYFKNLGFNNIKILSI